MNFREFEEQIKNVPYTESLLFAQAILWLHPDRMPLGVVSIGENASGIIKVPDMALNRYERKVPVIAIRRDAFAGQEKVTDIVLPPGLRGFPGGAFAGCFGLRRITIPKSIRVIREGTFAGCDALEDVYYEGTRAEWEQVEIVHQKHEIEFGELTPGTPVEKVTAERLLHVPGNDALFSANIHFNCALSGLKCAPEFEVRMGHKDITEMFRTM